MLYEINPCTNISSHLFSNPYIGIKSNQNNDLYITRKAIKILITNLENFIYFILLCFKNVKLHLKKDYTSPYQYQGYLTSYFPQPQK